MDPTSHQQVDLRQGLGNINETEDPAQPRQEDPIAPDALPDQQDNTDDIYVSRSFPPRCYSGQKLAKACQEGGAPLINFLLAQAIPPNERDALLSTQSVRDWSFQDILHLPIVEREEWKKACHEELESLRA